MIKREKSDSSYRGIDEALQAMKSMNAEVTSGLNACD